MGQPPGPAGLQPLLLQYGALGRAGPAPSSICTARAMSGEQTHEGELLQPLGRAGQRPLTPALPCPRCLAGSAVVLWYLGAVTFLGQDAAGGLGWSQEVL